MRLRNAMLRRCALAFVITRFAADLWWGIHILLETGHGVKKPSDDTGPWRVLSSRASRGEGPRAARAPGDRDARRPRAAGHRSERCRLVRAGCTVSASPTVGGESGGSHGPVE